MTTTALRPELPPIPDRFRHLPVDHRGYPVPFFAAWVDGVPDHRVIDHAKIVRAVKEHLCWVCGQRLGTYLAFTIGPMCAVNRISGEPPEHRECAEWSVRGCPFLSRPGMHRREAGMPEGVVTSENSIARNPGVILVWVTKSYKIIRDTGLAGKVLFQIGDPLSVACYTEGREASAEEIAAAIDSGLPALAGPAKAEGPKAERALLDQLERARKDLGLVAA